MTSCTLNNCNLFYRHSVLFSHLTIVIHCSWNLIYKLSIDPGGCVCIGEESCVCRAQGCTRLRAAHCSGLCRASGRHCALDACSSEAEGFPDPTWCFWKVSVAGLAGQILHLLVFVVLVVEFDLQLLLTRQTPAAPLSHSQAHI